MRLDEWLDRATNSLAAAGIASARLDCLILLEDTTGRDRAWLLAHPEHGLTDEIVDELNKKCARRAGHLPLAYIRQRTEFFGRTFYVDEQVLEPRPESETMIDLLLDLPLPARPAILDAGTGSGALAITAKLELAQAQVTGTDIDPACLAVARRNAALLRADITLLEADLLGDRGQDADVILANLPYVPDAFTINQAAMNEPRHAIFGGPDGLELYRRMFAQLASPQPGRGRQQPAFVLCESLPPQHDGLAAIARASGYRMAQERDFIQVFQRLAD